MALLSLFAGPRALQTIKQQGLRSDLFSMLVAASGGPKWFVLYGLDRYLFGDFFAGREQPLHTIGSSIGAWRMACLATGDPVAAIDRLAELYSKERYSDAPDAREVSRSAQQLLEKVLGKKGADEVASNPKVVSHIIATRCRTWSNFGGKFGLAVALTLAAGSNLVTRSSLSVYFERTVFNNNRNSRSIVFSDDLSTSYVPLTPDRVCDALIASGSIPFALEGIRNFAGATPGLYLDGGIIDYHLDLPFSKQPGLVLYPHYQLGITPGWFDKKLFWRKYKASNFDNVLLLAPSDEFVASLPYRRIPDRHDFKTLDYDSRLRYWRSVLEQSQRLAAEFAELVCSKKGYAVIRPIREIADARGK